MLDFYLKDMAEIMIYTEGEVRSKKFPRHKEINENLAKMILRKWKL